MPGTASSMYPHSPPCVEDLALKVFGCERFYNNQSKYTEYLFDLYFPTETKNYTEQQLEFY
jgi:hypothetical protein